MLKKTDRTFPHWLSWMHKGSVAILDQGLISGSNFLISILLARWMAPEQYGAFSLAFAIALLFIPAFQALIYEPMTVFGPSVYQDCQREYLHALLRIYAGLAFAIFLALGLAAWVSQAFGRSVALPGALTGVALATPVLLLYGLARAAFYFQLRPQGALKGAVLYSALVLSGLWVISRRGLLSPFTAFILMAGAAGAGDVLLLLRLNWSLKSNAAAPSASEICRRHWEYGRWALASSVVNWLPWNIYYLAVGGVVGLVFTGTLRALLNLSMPFSQTITAISLLVLPYAARQHSSRTRAGIEGLTRTIVKLYAVGAVAYWGLIILFRHRVLHFLYVNRYTELGDLIPWLALASLIWIVANGLTISLRAMQTPASVFVAYCVASAVTLAAGIPAALWFGIRGAVWGMIVASLAALIVGWMMVRRQENAQVQVLVVEEA